MRLPQGYITITAPEGPLVEIDSFTCSHCQHIVRVPPFASPSEMGGWCGRCAKCICGPCADTGMCMPWEKQMEKMESRDRFLRSAGLLVLLAILCVSPAFAQKVPTIGPNDALQFDYRTADAMSYGVTHFVAQWDSQPAISLGMPDAYLTSATTSGAVSYRVPTPFTSGTHQVVFRACNPTGCGAGSAPFIFRGARK